MFNRDDDGSLAFSQIESEKLLSFLVERRLEELVREGQYPASNVICYLFYRIIQLSLPLLRLSGSMRHSQRSGQEPRLHLWQDRKVTNLKPPNWFLSISSRPNPLDKRLVPIGDSIHAYAVNKVKE